MAAWIVSICEWITRYKCYMYSKAVEEAKPCHETVLIIETTLEWVKQVSSLQEVPVVKRTPLLSAYYSYSLVGISYGLVSPCAVHSMNLACKSVKFQVLKNQRWQRVCNEPWTYSRSTENKSCSRLEVVKFYHKNDLYQTVWWPRVTLQEYRIFRAGITDARHLLLSHDRSPI